jgi:hypothetical protein
MSNIVSDAQRQCLFDKLVCFLMASKGFDRGSHCTIESLDWLHDDQGIVEVRDDGLLLLDEVLNVENVPCSEPLRLSESPAQGNHVVSPDFLQTSSAGILQERNRLKQAELVIVNCAT